MCIIVSFAHEIFKFLKVYYFLTCSFVSECLWTNFSHILRSDISKSKRYFHVKSSTYCFYKKTKILADFQICISVPLSKIYSCMLQETTVLQFDIFNKWKWYFDENNVHLCKEGLKWRRQKTKNTYFANNQQLWIKFTYNYFTQNNGLILHYRNTADISY